MVVNISVKFPKLSRTVFQLRDGHDKNNMSPKPERWETLFLLVFIYTSFFFFFFFFFLFCFVLFCYEVRAARLLTSNISAQFHLSVLETKSGISFHFQYELPSKIKKHSYLFVQTFHLSSRENGTIGKVNIAKQFQRRFRLNVDRGRYLVATDLPGLKIQNIRLKQHCRLALKKPIHCSND